MKVLWATCHRPDPNGGGGEAHEFTLIREASRTHQLTVVSSAVAPGEAPAYLTELGVDVIGVAGSPRPVPNRAGLLGVLATSHMPVTVWRHTPCAAALHIAVAEAERRVRPDLVQVWPSEVASVASVPAAPTALLLTDCFTRQAIRERRMATTRRQQLLWALELHNARRWERSAFSAPSALGCVSATDAAALAELTGRPLDIVPVALGDEWFEPPAVPRSPDEVMFIAALDYRPNVDAALWLARDIWPLVRERVPGAILHVVGRNPVTEVRRAIADCGGELHPDVPDVRLWYWRAAVALSPVRLGSGMRNKILHAMACGAPVVTTTASAEGIGGRDGFELVHADDPREFAAAVEGLLTDRRSAQALADRAGLLARSYTSAAVVAALERLWQRAISEARRAPSPDQV